MGERVLVAYATKHGATAEIAAKIGEVLRQAGLAADVKPASQVSDLARYDAVVLGSALYIGKWRKDAARFLRANQQTLAQRPLWLFSSGPTDTGDPVELLQGERVPKALQPTVDSIKPRDAAVFGGYNNAEKMSGFEKWIIKRVGAQMGDVRDWDAIASWAGTIAGQLQPVQGDAQAN